MKFSESWLRTLVDPQLTSAELSHLLTMAGLEVEELDPVAPAFDSVVVAHVLEVVKHPDADRLNVCKVDTGNGTPKTIVCGASNVAVGLKVPCALPGAKLPGDFTIKIAKVRGIESSGMLCSAKELGIAEEASGLLILPADAPVGQSIRQYLELDDSVFELKLTPNRADCLSLLGIAREVGAITGAATSLPVVPEVAATIAETRAVVLDATDACPLYCGRLFKGVNAKAPTPEWMKRRLERSGIRAICESMDKAGLTPPLFDSDRNRDEFVTRFFFHHFLGEDDIRWLAQFKDLHLSDEEARALVVVREAGLIDNATYRSLNKVDTLAASTALRRLRDIGLLAQQGRGSATRYRPTDKLIKGVNEILSGTSGSASSMLDSLSSVSTSLSSKPESLSSMSGQKRNTLLNELPGQLAARVGAIGQRHPPDEVRALVVALCQARAWTAEELASLLNRKPETIRQDYLRPLLARNHITMTIPDKPKSPQQAYRAVEARQRQ